MLWGHASHCECVVCHTLPRLHLVVASGSRVPGFVTAAGQRLRLAEAELRDKVIDLVKEGSKEAPSASSGVAATSGPSNLSHPPGPAAPLPPPPPPPIQVDPSLIPIRPGVLQASQTAGDLPLRLATKSKPPEPPAPPPIPVKTEEQEDKKPLVEAEYIPYTGEGLAKKRKKSPKDLSSEERERKRKKKESKRKKKSSSGSPPRARSSGRQRSEPKSQKEKKVREEVEPSQPSRQQPREPSHPPPDRVRDRQPRGRGWRGEIPRSDHFRWHSGKNKGIVKRAKQERYNRYR